MITNFARKSTNFAYQSVFLDTTIEMLVDKYFDLRPAAIIEKLQLRKPQYRQLAAYGHMGRIDLDVAWEKTDMAETLKEAVKNF